MNNLSPGTMLSDIPGNESDAELCTICCRVPGEEHVDLYQLPRRWCLSCQNVARADQLAEIHAALHKLYEQDGIMREYHAPWPHLGGILYHQKTTDGLRWTTKLLKWSELFELITTSFPEET